MVPITLKGKMFCMIFMGFGIPYFATMMSVLSESIHITAKLLTQKLTGSTKHFSFYYILVGFVVLLLLPTLTFMKMEG